MRIIPKTAKVKIEFFKNISLADTFIGLAALALEVLVFTTNIPPISKYAIMIMILAVSIWLYMPFDGQRFYMMFVNMAKYVVSVKHYSKDFTKANLVMILKFILKATTPVYPVTRYHTNITSYSRVNA